MIRILFFSRNTLLAEGFRSLLAGEEGVTLVTKTSIPSLQDDLPKVGRVTAVLIDSKLLLAGCPHCRRLLSSSVQHAIVVSEESEILRLPPSLPSSERVLRADLDSDRILEFILRLAGASPWVRYPDDFPQRPRQKLTAREIEMLQQAAEGLSNKEIATVCSLSVETVKFHVRNAMKKLGVFNRTAAVVKAVRLGWVEIAPFSLPPGNLQRSSKAVASSRRTLVAGREAR